MTPIRRASSTTNGVQETIILLQLSFPSKNIFIYTDELKFCKFWVL